jgi:hypothetical protein
MKVIRELNRDKLLHSFQQDRDFGYIQNAIVRHSCCYLASVDQDDLSKFLVNSSPKHPELPLNQYPSIIAILSEIREPPGFLEVTPSDGYRGLNGPRIKKKMEEFKLGKKPEDCFIEDVWLEMEREGAFYIVDGMHRLVAYALWSDLKADKFPITLYCCTNKPLQEIEGSES